MKAAAEYRIHISSKERKCCLCLSPHVGPTDLLFREEENAGFTEVGKMFLVLLSMNEKLLSQYCCITCTDKVVACFEAFLDLNVAALRACQISGNGSEDQVPTIHCAECSADLPSTTDLSKHLKHHMLDLSLEIAEDTSLPLKTHAEKTPPKQKKSEIKRQQETKSAVASISSPKTLTQKGQNNEAREIVRKRAHQAESPAAPRITSAHSPPEEGEVIGFNDFEDGNEACVASPQHITSNLDETIRFVAKGGNASCVDSAEPVGAKGDDSILGGVLSHGQAMVEPGYTKRKRTRVKGSAEKCYLCGKGFSTRLALNRHLLTHDVESLKKYFQREREKPVEHVCDICGTICKSAWNLHQHRQTHEIPTCTVCGKAIIRQNMKRHLLTHSRVKSSRRFGPGSNPADLESMDRSPVICTHCSKPFNDKSMLNNHLVLKHGASFGALQQWRGKRRAKVCSACGQFFSSDVKLKSHTLEAHGQMLLFPCEECGKAFQNKILLRNHIRVEHMPHASYHCPQCLKPFKSFQSFWAHKRTHQQFKRYQCGTCPSRFYNRCETFYHLAKHVEAGAAASHSAHVLDWKEEGKEEADILYLKDHKGRVPRRSRSGPDGRTARPSFRNKKRF